MPKPRMMPLSRREIREADKRLLEPLLHHAAPFVDRPAYPEEFPEHGSLVRVHWISKLCTVRALLDGDGRLIGEPVIDVEKNIPANTGEEVPEDDTH